MRLAVLTVLALAGSVHGIVHAQPKKDPTPVTVSCELYEVALSNEKDAGKPDPDLKPLAKKLGKPPFSTWNTQKLLSHTTQVLAQNTTATYAVKMGKVQALLQNVTAKTSVQMQLQVDDSKGKRVLNTQITIAGADFFMTTRSEANNTQHLIALTCK